MQTSLPHSSGLPGFCWLTRPDSAVVLGPVGMGPDTATAQSFDAGRVLSLARFPPAMDVACPPPNPIGSVHGYPLSIQWVILCDVHWRSLIPREQNPLVPNRLGSSPCFSKMRCSLDS